MTALLSAPAGALPADVVTAITGGFASLSGTVTQLLIIAIPVTVTVVVVTAGTKYAIKLIKGLLNKAAV